MPIETVRTIIKANNKTRQIDSSKVVAINFTGAGALRSEFDTHVNDNNVHVTALKQSAWNAKADIDDIPTKLSQLDKDINFNELYYTETEINAKFAAQNNEIVAIVSDVDALQAVSHTHTNKTVLDATQQAFTNTLKTNYDTAYSWRHEHNNEFILDNTTASFTNELKESYDGAVSKGHTHANKLLLDGLTNDNVVSQTAITTALNNKEPLIAKLSAFNTAFGTAEGTTCEGNDARLTDKREPLAHTNNDTDIIFTDVTTGNASTTKHGYLPKLPGDVNKYLNGLGTFTTPPGGGGGSAIWGSIGGILADQPDLMLKFQEYYTKTESNTNFVPKETGKGLSTNDYTDAEKTKLSGIEANANNYVLPSTLEPTIINQNATNRFVSDTQIDNWNAKSNFSGSYTDLTNKPTLFSGSYPDLTNKPTIPTTLAGLTDDATHRLVTDTEKSTWNGKQDALASGTNIKTINSVSLLGSGNIAVEPKTTVYSQSTLTIDGSLGTWFECSISANASFTLSNINTGQFYYTNIYNSGAAIITITLPNTRDKKEALTATIGIGKAKTFAFIDNGTNRIWQISAELT